MKGKSLKLWTASVVYEEREAVPGEIVEIGKGSWLRQVKAFC